MTSLAIGLLFLGFYLIYNASTKTGASRNSYVQKIAQQRPNSSRLTGIVLLLISYSLELYSTTIVAATLNFVIQLMTVAGLVIILVPLKIIGFRTVMTILLLALFFETLQY